MKDTVEHSIIKKRRLELGMTQDDVVREVKKLVGGMGQSAYQKVEKGDTQRSRFLPAICKVLKLRIEDVDPSLALDSESAIEMVFSQIDLLPLADQVRVAHRVFAKLADKDQVQ